MREVMSPRLSERTTLHLGGTAIAELILESVEDCARLPERLRSLGGSPLILGAGSNILAADGELPLVLIRPAFESGPKIVSQNDKQILVQAGAGVPLPRLLRFCLRHSLSGLEGLTGIPGSVGGAIAMNAGSFGVQTCEKIKSIQVSIGGEIHTVYENELQYAYRSMSIAGKCHDFIIINATFALTESSSDGIKKVMCHNFFEKKFRQPVTAWSAGCVFKNPAPDMPAGKLLDMVGLKGKKLGGMAFSEVHANFLINEGSGIAEAALTLLREAKEKVLMHFGVELEPEVRLVPCLSL